MDRSVGKWKLPQPTDLKDEEQKEWIQIPRIARTVPFGYKLNEEDSDLLDPIPFELEAIEVARKNEKQRKDKARTLRKWAAYAEKAIEKAKAIEEQTTGARA